MTSEIVRIDQFGILTSGFRNIRCGIDNTRAVFDLIPEQLVAPASADLKHVPSFMRKHLDGARLVVEGQSALRLEFDCVLGVAVDTDTGVDLFGGLQANWVSAPRLEGSKSFYPLLEITNSPWKGQLPEWGRRDDPAIRHIRMISAECSFDVLGEFSSGAWMANAGT